MPQEPHPLNYQPTPKTHAGRKYALLALAFALAGALLVITALIARNELLGPQISAPLNQDPVAALLLALPMFSSTTANVLANIAESRSPTASAVTNTARLVALASQIVSMGASIPNYCISTTAALVLAINLAIYLDHQSEQWQ